MSVGLAPAPPRSTIRSCGTRKLPAVRRGIPIVPEANVIAKEDLVWLATPLVEKIESHVEPEVGSFLNRHAQRGTDKRREFTLVVALECLGVASRT